MQHRFRKSNSRQRKQAICARIDSIYDNSSKGGSSSLFTGSTNLAEIASCPHNSDMNCSFIKPTHPMIGSYHERTGVQASSFESDFSSNAFGEFQSNVPCKTSGFSRHDIRPECSPWLPTGLGISLAPRDSDVSCQEKEDPHVLSGLGIILPYGSMSTSLDASVDLRNDSTDFDSSAYLERPLASVNTTSSLSPTQSGQISFLDLGLSPTTALQFAFAENLPSQDDSLLSGLPNLVDYEQQPINTYYNNYYSDTSILTTELDLPRFDGPFFSTDTQTEDAFALQRHYLAYPSIDSETLNSGGFNLLPGHQVYPKADIDNHEIPQVSSSALFYSPHHYVQRPYPISDVPGLCDFHDSPDDLPSDLADTPLPQSSPDSYPPSPVSPTIPCNINDDDGEFRSHGRCSPLSDQEPTVKSEEHDTTVIDLTQPLYTVTSSQELDTSRKKDTLILDDDVEISIAISPRRNAILQDVTNIGPGSRYHRKHRKELDSNVLPPVKNAHAGVSLDDISRQAALYRAYYPDENISPHWLMRFAGQLSADGTMLDYFRCYVKGCSQTNRRRDHIITHVGAHLDERPFPCSYCSERFFRNNELKRHEARHVGTKPHICDLCFPGRSFTRLDLLTRHKKKAHGMEPERRKNKVTDDDSSVCVQ